MKRLLGVVIFFAVLATTARADMAFGPWVFDDRAFGDDAEQLEPGTLQLTCRATDVVDALTKFSPDRQLANIGYAGNANDFAIYFHDLRAVNEPGPDLVFFESAFSFEGFRIAVRPLGGVFGVALEYPPEDFIDTGESRCQDSVILGLPIDLDDFGLPAGAVADGLRFQAIPRPGDPTSEGDPVMAAVLASTCPPLPDSDDDGIGDACDCEPFGVRPDEPTDLRVLPDHRTFTHATSVAAPGAIALLLRGDLMSLRSGGGYDLLEVDEAPTAGNLDDPQPPAPGAPSYYLIITRECDGSDSSLGRNSFGVERRR